MKLPPVNSSGDRLPWGPAAAARAAGPALPIANRPVAFGPSLMPLGEPDGACMDPCMDRCLYMERKDFPTCYRECRRECVS